MFTLKTVLPAALNQIRQGSTFLSIKNYLDNFGGRSNFGIVFHVDYIKAVEKSVNIWWAYKPRNSLERIARIELINSYSDTLKGHNPRALSAHAYSRISDGTQIIKSVKWHDNGRACHFWGFIVHKIILESAKYPNTDSSDGTIARAKLMSLAPIDRFRQFKIVDGRFDLIGVESLSFNQKDLLRSIT
jgi:hypothetical protein